MNSLAVEIDGEAFSFTSDGETVSFNKDILGPYAVEYVLETAETINIIAQARDENATISGDKNQAIDLSYDKISQSFIVTVTAEDEVTTKEYVVELWTTRVDPDDNNDILAITATIDSSRFDAWNTVQKTHRLKLFIDEEVARFLFIRGVETSKLYVVVDEEAQEIESNGTQNVYAISLNTGEERIYNFYCVAEDHTKSDIYTLTILRAADNDASLATLTYNGTTVPGFTAGMNAMFPFEVLIGDLDEVTIAATTTKSTTTISTLANPYSLNPGDNLLVVETTAQDGITQFHYIINFIKDADKVLDDIEAIIVEESAEVNLLTPEFDSTTYSGYSVELDYENDSLLIRYASELNTALLVLPDDTIVEGENKSFTIENIEVGTNLYKIRVQTASGATEDYELSITRKEPDTDATLKELTYNGIAVPGFTAGMESDEFEIFIKDEEEVYFAAVPTKTTTSVENEYDYSNLALLSIGENGFTITTLAQDGETSCTYVIKVIMDAPLTLDSLEVIVNSENKTPDFDPTEFVYTVDLEYTEKDITISYATSYAEHNTICFIDSSGQEIENDTNTLTINDFIIDQLSTYRIRITGYSGEYNEYEIQIYRDPGSDDNTILSFKYKASDEDTELTELDINASNTQYSYVVDRNMSVFDPEIELSDSKASYTLPDDNTLISGQANIKEIVVTSENG
ncbi:MAG: cadherin-like beta sandwich domain-containing protein, partial [Anaeroplasmataceae bacterium]|nr:cadherin-like beta sandwich domain-containing protein [Anaeroplasmataceae bacterium]